MSKLVCCQGETLGDSSGVEHAPEEWEVKETISSFKCSTIPFDRLRVFFLIGLLNVPILLKIEKFVVCTNAPLLLE
jgi:hypothetical protein